MAFIIRNGVKYATAFMVGAGVSSGVDAGKGLGKSGDLLKLAIVGFGAYIIAKKLK